MAAVGLPSGEVEDNSHACPMELGHRWVEIGRVLDGGASGAMISGVVACRCS